MGSPYTPCNGTCPPSQPPGFSPQPLFWHELRPAVDADLPWAQPGGPCGLSNDGAELSPAWTPKEAALPHSSGPVESVVAAPVWLQTSYAEMSVMGHPPHGADSPMAMHHSGAFLCRREKPLSWGGDALRCPFFSGSGCPVWLQTTYAEMSVMGHPPHGADSPMAMHHSGARVLITPKNLHDPSRPGGQAYFCFFLRRDRSLLLMYTCTHTCSLYALTAPLRACPPSAVFFAARQALHVPRLWPVAARGRRLSGRRPRQLRALQARHQGGPKGGQGALPL